MSDEFIISLPGKSSHMLHLPQLLVLIALITALWLWKKAHREYFFHIASIKSRWLIWEVILEWTKFTFSFRVCTVYTHIITSQQDYAFLNHKRRRHKISVILGIPSYSLGMMQHGIPLFVLSISTLFSFPFCHIKMILFSFIYLRCHFNILQLIFLN